MSKRYNLFLGFGLAMMSWLRRLWGWFRSLFGGRSRDPVSVQAVRQEPTGLDYEYENALLGLLAELEGLTAGRLRGFLMMRGVEPEGLARWLRLSGMEGLSRSQNGEVLARGLRGLALVATGELAEAAIAVARGLEGVGRVRETQAEEAFSVLEGELFDEAVAWFVQGSFLVMAGRDEEAIASHDRAIEFKPDYHEAGYGRGIALDNLGENEKAIASYDRALTLTQGKLWQAWYGRSIAASKSTGRGSKNPLFAYTLPPTLNHPDLDLRGYPGLLACLREGLKYVQRETDPEGWGQLHRATGRQHYGYARSQKNPIPYWHKAVPCYETALETLTRVLPIPHLQTLQQYIRVLTALQETDQAQTLLRDGTAFLTRHLADQSEAVRKQLERQFKPTFNELTVALAVQSGDYSTALVIAEQDKNALLRQSLLANRPATSPDYPQIQTFLQTQPRSAILYWHLSANALTTFLLLPDRPDPIALTTDLPQLLQLETWIKTWKTDYQTHRTQKTEKSPPSQGGLGGSSLRQEQPTQSDWTQASSAIPPSPPLKGGKIEESPPSQGGLGGSWRDRLPQNLAALQTLLSIPAIESHLTQLSQCDRLILIPHRDLHLLPLDSLFDPQYSISYLPSLQIGINLQTRPPQPRDRLLSIENPDSIQKESDGTIKTFPALTAAEAESELICQMYSAPTRRDKSQTKLKEVTDQLSQPHTILHFTGHGYYDYSQPLNSALALSQQDRLTLTDIVTLDLSTYDLACLCACETAIAANQTITTEYIGIVSAFMYANVGKVISTLWTVESVASAILMVEFHRRRLDGTPTAQALHQAKQWLKKATATDLQTWYQQTHDSLPPDRSLRNWLKARQRENAKIEPNHPPYQNPYYWAAFTLTGL